MDLHEQFLAWLAAGGRGEPARDVALHASGCDACLRHAAALDALTAVDPGLAPPPPLRVAATVDRRGTPDRVARALTGIAAMGLLGTAVVVGVGALLDRPATELGAEQPSAAEGVLGGELQRSSTPSATPSPSNGGASLSPSPSTSPTLTFEPATAPPPAATAPAAVNEPPTVAPVPTAVPAPPPPTQAPPPPPPQDPPPTAAPVMTPTPTPTPTPVPVITTPTPSPTPTEDPGPAATPSGDPEPTEP